MRSGRSWPPKSDVTAVFCANDTLALGLVRALTERGRRVPDDISVVGFDDVPEAGYFLPPLTTVRQDFGEVGRLALSALVDRIASGPGPGVHLAVPPELVVRASAAPPPGPAGPAGPGRRAGADREGKPADRPTDRRARDDNQRGSHAETRGWARITGATAGKIKQGLQPRKRKPKDGSALMGGRHGC